MKNKTKSFAYHTILLGLAGLLTVASYWSCNKDKDKQHKPSNSSANQINLPPPSTNINDYNQHDVKQMQDFFRQPSASSLASHRTNEDILKSVEPDFNINKPWTWKTYCIFNTQTKQLVSIKLYYSYLKGTLDLTGCDGIHVIDLSNSGITLVKIPKRSFAGRFGWFVENATSKNLEDLNATQATDPKQIDAFINKTSISQPLPTIKAKGPVTLTQIYFNSFNSFLQKHHSSHPFKNNSGGNITVILVD